VGDRISLEVLVGTSVVNTNVGSRILGLGFLLDVFCKAMELVFSGIFTVEYSGDLSSLNASVVDSSVRISVSADEFVVSIYFFSMI